MKKSMVLLVSVLILASFFSILVLAEDDTSVNAGVNAQVSVGANMNQDNYSGQQEMEQHQGDSQQNQEENQNALKGLKNSNLTEAQIRNIIQIRNRLHVEGQNGNCPEECECEGVVIKCELANGTRQLMIHAGNSNNTIIQVKGANASTQVILYKDGEKVYGVFRNNQTGEIILPDKIKEMLQNRTRARLENETYNLTENGEYHVEARKRARLFWVIPVQERTQLNVDAQTGEVIQTRNSWWGFLARDVRVNTDANASTSTQ